MRTPRRVPGDEYRVFTVERTWGIVRAVFERPLRALFRMRVYGVDRIPRTVARCSRSTTSPAPTSC